MEWLEIADGLNGLTEVKGPFEKKKSDSLNFKFYSGDYKQILKELINKLCPYGKVALFFKEKSFEDFGKGVSEFIESTGAVPISVLFSEKTEFSVDVVCGAFNLPENVRALLVCDKELFDVASYFANIKNIPLIIIPSSFAVGGALSPKIYIKNGDKSDCVEVKANKRIIIDGNFIDEKTLACGFGEIISKIVPLLDYRIYGAVTGKHLSNRGYDAARSSVTDVYDKCAANSGVKPAVIFNGLKYEIANAVSGGEIELRSATYAAKQFFSPFVKCGADVEFFAFLKIIKAYKIWTESENGILNTINYLERAEKATEKLGLSENEVFAALETQINLLRRRSAVIKTVKKNLTGEIEFMSKTADNFEKLYYKLGGKKLSEETNTEIKNAVLMSGDFPEALNGVSVMRDEGLLDALKD